MTQTAPEISPETLASLEAVLFMHGDPVKDTRLAEILSLSVADVHIYAQALQTAYAQRHAGLTIMIVDHAIQMVTHTTQATIIESVIKKERNEDLSASALEVLAIIAYRGPIAKPDIEAIRGVNCAFTLRNLFLRGLIERIPHPTDHRTKLYRITMDLLRSLGIDTPEQLPQFDDLAKDPRIDAVLYHAEERLHDEGDNQASSTTTEQ